MSGGNHDTLIAMTLNEFEQLIERHGSDIACWPQAEAESARALLESSREARAVLNAASIMQEALSPRPSPATPAGLLDRIMANLQDRK